MNGSDIKTAPFGSAAVRDSVYPIKEKAQPYYLTSENNDSVAVLIHGFTGSPNDMRELADFLFSRGIDAYAVRVAGHGTHIDDLMQTTYEDWLASVKNVVDELHGSGKRIFLVGYSFGANLVLDLAAKDPKLYEGIVCLGTSIYWRSRAYYYILYNIFRLFGIKKVRKPYVPKYNIETFEAAGNYAVIPTNGLGRFRDFVRHHTRRKLHQVTTPVLIIHSRDDRISDPKSSDYLFEHIGSQYKEMFVLRELNHNPLRSDNKNTIFERVVHFIQN